MIAVAVGPFLLPAVGLSLADVVFVLPMVACTAAAVRCAGAARRAPVRRASWLLFAGAALAAALASGAGFVSSVSGMSLTSAYYAGFSGSVALAAASVRLALMRQSPPRPEQLFDAVLTSGLIAAVGVYYVAVPGFQDGDVLLTACFLLDITALLLVAASLHGGAPTKSIAWLATGLVAASAGDGLVAASATGAIEVGGAAIAFLWAVAGVAVQLAAGAEDGSVTPPAASDADVRFPYLRALAPLPVVLAFPALAVVQIAREGVSSGPIVYFGVFFLFALLLGFGRQAYLVVVNRRTAAREREVRADATRRNEELQALTGLAATMTESLEEDAIVERGLDVLRLAARATSAGLHLDADAGLELRAIAGRWQSDSAFVETVAPEGDKPEVEERGRRAIARFPLAARGASIGVVTLVRAADDRFDEEELSLLRLLVAQLGIAVQNARDYGEKLDQALRDPLTGLYNRRYFYDALDKEVERERRYSTPVSLVFFDIDDFKWINDEHGHAAGDKVLRGIAETVVRLLRPSDTIARIGGEEFALLLPETERLEALLVAERVRGGIARANLFPHAQVRVSAGIASCPEHARSATDLAKKADDALYWAKGNGKDLCAVASEVVVEDDADQRSVAHLNALVGMIDGRLNTRDHSTNVARNAAAIGSELGLADDTLMRLRRAAMLHDVGKIAVSPDVLAKPGPLDPEELAQLREHPGVGAIILGQAGLGDEADWVRHHHERVDGHGYPDGLRGRDIPLEAKVLAVADAFEAMTSGRPYSERRGPSDALAELRRCSGTQFEARVVDALASALATTAARSGDGT